jgi:hypothetical protein
MPESESNSDSREKAVISDDLLRIVRDTAEAGNMTPDEKKWPSVAILAGPMETVEIIVRMAAKRSGFPMNWGYVGGRAVVHSPGDRAKCRAAIHQAIPQTDIQPEEYFA